MIDWRFFTSPIHHERADMSKSDRPDGALIPRNVANNLILSNIEAHNHISYSLALCKGSV